MSRQLDEHREYLDDRRRVEAFASAIAAAVRPGDVVVDLGCGTGIFGLLACRAGAARVYAIDQTDMAEIARALAAANGFGDRVTAVRGFSMDVALPERADVIVSDQIGHFGWEAGVLEFFHDAKRRLAKPDARFVPRRVDLWLAPIESSEAWAEMSFWRTAPFGFDMSAAQRIADNSGYPRQIDPSSLLGPAIRAASLDPTADNGHFTATADLTIDRPGTLHAIAGWFSAELGDGVVVTNAPGDPGRIDRRQALFPIGVASTLQPAQTVRVAMTIRPRDLLVKWTVDIPGDGDAAGGRRPTRIARCTFDGMPISPDDVRRLAPSFVPRLTPRGAARRLVIEAIDGCHSIGDIEALVFERHRELFAAEADAAVFVAEVVSRYTE